ncbi:MAG TPA: hypothetical protein VM509_08815 [Planctomycetota bacterium]|nr:hypothetical protein [Planctomycetota bacterium]
MSSSPEPSPELVTFAGIDEAGLGPMLGPLCLGYSVFRAPKTGADLWKTLKPAVSGKVGREGKRFVVADSKVVFTRTPVSAKRLEKTALGFLSLLHPERLPPRNGQCLAWESPRELAVDASTIAQHPWYAPLETDLPRHQERGGLEIAVERLSRTLTKERVELLDAGVRVVPERHLNASFARTDNKALSTWHELALIMKRVYAQHAHSGLRLTVDRQGGRMHYGPLLKEMFPCSNVRCAVETAPLSAYVVLERAGSRRMRVVFAERGEQFSFAVALGSCLAKYARETCMDAFNASFARHDPQLEPTAGYLTDAHRWLADAAPAMQSAGWTRADLARSR